MSSTTDVASSTTTSAAVPSSTGVCTSNLYDTPVHDVVCAVPYDKDNIGFMTDCCKGSDVVSYYDNCGLYCLVVDQSVDDISECLFGKKIPYQNVFCRGNGTDTATGTSNPDLPATASASVIGSSTSSADSSDDDNKDGDDKNSDDSKDDSSSNDKDGAAPKVGISMLGLAIGTLLFTSFTLA